MGRALQLLSGRATNPGATFTALTTNTGDSFTVKNFDSGRAWIISAWTKEGTLGSLRIRSQLLHDNAQGIQARTPLISKSRPLIPLSARQYLEPQDPLTVEITGGAAETDIASMLVYYEDTPGVQAQYISPEELASRTIDESFVPVNITSGGTAGQYGGGVAMNATGDQYKRKYDYAIMGYLVDTELGSVGFQAPEFGNLRIGGPGSTDAFNTRDWFVQLSKAQGIPLIPVFSAADVPTTVVDVTDTGTATAIVVTLCLARLSGT